MSEASAPSETPPATEPSISAEQRHGTGTTTPEVPGASGEPGAPDEHVEVDLDAIERDLDGIERALERLADGTYWNGDDDTVAIPADRSAPADAGVHAADDAPASSTDHR